MSTSILFLKNHLSLNNFMSIILVFGSFIFGTELFM